MEARLKDLKVVNLKEVLTRAKVSIPARANKPDLIAKILGSFEATAAFEELHGGGSVKPSGANTPRPAPVEEDAKKQVAAAATPKKPDILAPPEEFDWSAGTVSSTETTEKNTTELAINKSNSAVPRPPASSASSSTNAQASQAKTFQSNAEEDEEIKRRRARAERFGIPLVTNPSEPTVKKPAKPAITRSASAATTNGTNTKPKATKDTIRVEEDPEKLKARAMRFGSVEKAKHVIPSSEAAAIVTGQKTAAEQKTATGQKRPAPRETIDSEEAERRRKRAERFGLPVKS